MDGGDQGPVGVPQLVRRGSFEGFWRTTAAVTTSVALGGLARAEGLELGPNAGQIAGPTTPIGGCEFADLDALITRALSPSGGLVQRTLEGAAFLVSVDGEVVYRKAFGNLGFDTPIGIASATKWLSGAVVMSLVDSGEWTLETRVSQHLPSFDVPIKRGITIGQAFSHTSGLPGEAAALSDSTLTLRESADAIAMLPLRYLPGTAFLYGGPSMQAVGAAAEVASGTEWTALFDERVGARLGLVSTAYTEFAGPMNPRIAGGAVSSFDDYAAFLDMITRRGVTASGVRVLSEAAVDAMLASQSGSPPIVSTPLPGVSDYGVGVWRETADPATGAPLVVSSPGAFGATPWIDFGRGYSALLMTESSYTNALPLLTRLRQLIAVRFDGDLTGDGVIDVEDLYAIALAPADVNGSGTADEQDVADLTFVVRACEASERGDRGR